MEVVRIALRTAFHVQLISKRLGGEFSYGPWSVAVSNATEVEVRKELSAFYKTHVCIPKATLALILNHLDFQWLIVNDRKLPR